MFKEFNGGEVQNFKIIGWIIFIATLTFGSINDLVAGISLHTLAGYRTIGIAYASNDDGMSGPEVTLLPLYHFGTSPFSLGVAARMGSYTYTNNYNHLKYSDSEQVLSVDLLFEIFWGFYLRGGYIPYGKAHTEQSTLAVDAKFDITGYHGGLGWSLSPKSAFQVLWEINIGQEVHKTTSYTVANRSYLDQIPERKASSVAFLLGIKLGI